jgi:acetyl esterase/lipase
MTKMIRPEVEALRQQFRDRDILGMSKVEQMRESVEQLAIIDPAPENVNCQPVAIGDVRAEWVRPPAVRSDRALLYLHGGGYVIGSVNSHRALIARVAQSANVQALGLDYRRAPEHPFPAPVEDASEAYRWMLTHGLSANHIAIVGDSAGGGLVFAVLVSIRDARLPMPACGVAISPWTDLEALGKSYSTNSDFDNLCHRRGILNLAQLYLAGHDPREPLAAPLYADLTALPPLLIHVTGDETLLDDSTRIAERAREYGVNVTLKTWSEMPHVFQLFLPSIPESQASLSEIGEFISTKLGLFLLRAR